jgi:hypothetical protein
MLLRSIFRYNAALWPEGLDLVDLENAQERKSASGRGETNPDVILLSLLSPDVTFFLGGYVDDANPSASERQAARAMLPIWHSM